MKKILRIILVPLSIVVLFNGCEGLFEEDLIEEGSYMFWSNFDGPPIDIYVERVKYGTISEFFPTAPGCETSGCVTVTLEPGTYELYATEKSGGSTTPREWNDIFTVRPNACGKKGLTAN